MWNKRGVVGGLLALTYMAGSSVGSVPAASAAPLTRSAERSADGEWAVIEHPAPPGQEDFPLRGVWVQGKEVWAVGHAYADLFWKPWGVRCIQLSCTQLNLASVDDSVVATAAAIDGTSPSDVWVVGRQLFKHFDGSSWQSVATTVAGAVTWSDVDVVSPTDVWVVGTVESEGPPRTVAAHWDGSTWHEDTVAIPAGCGEGPEPQVVATNGNVHMTTSCDGRGTVLVRGGLAWLTVFDTPAQIYGLDLVDGVIWATGTTGTVEPRVWRARLGHWHRAKAPKDGPGAVFAMAGRSRDDRWAVGAVPFGPEPAWLVSHWDGSTWTPAAQPPGTFMPILYDIGIDAEGRPWTVGGETNGCPHPNCGDPSLLLRGPSHPATAP